MMDDSDIDGPVAVCSLFLYRNSKCGHIILNLFSTYSQHALNTHQNLLNIFSTSARIIHIYRVNRVEKTLGATL